ncbi:MAG: tRNA pseudouridine(55) synthase TruB [Cyanobacteria bacterium P01_C01_bin.89]
MQGFINLHKPKGMTSHDCVGKLRRLLRQKRIGHGGTLDPAATGVLPVAVGPATRLLPYLQEWKSYNATIRFGLVTNTDDLAGDVIEERSPQELRHLTREIITEQLSNFTGSISQIPPKYSAIHVQGKRAYDLARQNKPVEIPSREVEILQLRILDWRNGDYPELDLAVDCGPGTYIRAIARDLGAALGTGATLAALERTRSCGFVLSESLTFEAIAQQIEAEQFQLEPVFDTLCHLPQIQLEDELVKRWFLGQRLPVSPNDILNWDPAAAEELDGEKLGPAIAVSDLHQNCLGVGHLRANRDPDASTVILAPKVVLPLPEA